MPTYEYKCNACDHRFEEFQSMKDKALKKCPECGKNALERLIGLGGGVIFKGSGFYETDYRSDSYKQSAEAEQKSGEGHVHTGSCACGKKPADQCGAASGGGTSSESKSGASSNGAKPEKKADKKPAKKAAK